MRIVGLGEVLFDVFEGGIETLGGAPLNVALHAHQLVAHLGVGEGVVTSRVGDDRHGTQILGLLANRGMATECVQIDPEHPTGIVSVFMRNGEPGYQIEAGAAWDFITPSEQLDELASKCDAVCFGSLAQRTPVSRTTIRRFLQHASQALRLYDINLRRDTLTQEASYSAAVIEESCQLATIMKLNEVELAEICRLFDIGGSADEAQSETRTRIDSVLKRFPVGAVILTRGAEGTTFFTHTDEFHGHGVPVPLANAHPVGAGDACSAGFLFGLALGWQRDDAVDLANLMGSWVASQLSATPSLPDSILAFVRERTYAYCGSDTRFGYAS